MSSHRENPLPAADRLGGRGWRKEADELPSAHLYQGTAQKESFQHQPLFRSRMFSQEKLEGNDIIISSFWDKWLPALGIQATEPEE